MDHQKELGAPEGAVDKIKRQWRAEYERLVVDPDPIKLDLGAGPASPEGFLPIGNAHPDKQIFPLPYPDDSVEEIRASHVLEHFPHREVSDVVADWVRALKPGGRLRIAVPDLEKIAKAYLAGAQADIQGYLMGGQLDEHDFHRSAFDAEALSEVMRAAGLALIRPWRSEIDDCAAQPVSLNLEGRKARQRTVKTRAVMSVPRLGFMDNFFACFSGVASLNIPIEKVTGSNWGQCLERGMETVLEDEDLDLVLTLDYDTIFRRADTEALIETFLCHPEIDALAPIQSSRHVTSPLFTIKNEAGTNKAKVPVSDFAGDITEVATAHFGLTLIDARKLRQLPKPWLHHLPAHDGTWHDGHVDDDIGFWLKWRKEGNRLFIANRVPVGHAELMVRWPGADLAAIYQPISEWHKAGAPKEMWR